MNLSLRKVLPIVCLLSIFPILAIAQDATINLQAVQRGITNITNQTRPSDYGAPAEVLRLEAAGDEKFPKPSAVRVGGFCKGLEGGIESGIVRLFLNDSDFIDACQDWELQTKGLENSVEKYYQNATGNICATWVAAGIDGNGCRPSRDQIGEYRTRVAAARGSISPSANVTNAEGTVERLEARYAAECITAEQITGAACTELQTQIDAAKVTAERAAEVADTSPCSALNFFSNFGECVYRGIVYIFKVVIIGFIAGPILNIAGLVFDASLSFSVIGFPKLLGSLGVDGSQSESSIYSTWIIVRNLFNIIIVFQLLKIAIYKILSPVLNKSGSELKKLLASIIIFTLFVNFSFFFTKALIDISNITTLQFYAGLGAGTDREDPGIDVAITEALGVSTAQIFGLSQVDEEVYRGVTAEEGATISDDSFAGSFLGVILLFCLLILASFVLLQGAAIFLTRSVVLIFLLVFSPLMFAGGIIGFVNKWSEKWWNMLMEQLFVAPLYLGMLFITLKIAGDGQTYGLLTIINNPSITTIASDPNAYFGSIVSMIIQAIIMAGLFISAVSLAKEFGGAAAKKSSAWGARAYGAAVGGAGGYALRKTAGRAANRFGNNEWLNNKKANGGIFTKTLATGTLSALDRTKNGSFDFRNSDSIKKANGAAGKFGLDLDKAGAGFSTKDGKGKVGYGFAAERDAQEKALEKKIVDKSKSVMVDTSRLSGAEKVRVEADNTRRQEEYIKNKGTDPLRYVTSPLEIVREKTGLSNTKTQAAVAENALKKAKKENAKVRAKKDRDDALEETMYKNVKFTTVPLLDESGNEIGKALSKNADESRKDLAANKADMQRLFDEQIKSLEDLVSSVTETYEDYELDAVGNRKTYDNPETGGVEYKKVTKTRTLREPLVTDIEEVKKINQEIQKRKSYRESVSDKWVEGQLEGGASSDKSKKDESSKSDDKKK